MEDLQQNLIRLIEGEGSLKQKMQSDLGLDDLNMEYFLILYRKFLKGKTSAPLSIAMDGKKGLFPTAIASEEMLAELPLVHYTDLKESESASQALLWVKKMQAGTGSSIVRKDYLNKMGHDGSKIGAKGTDLFAPSGESLVEVQIKQALSDTSRIEAICLHDIVSSETAAPIDKTWEKINETKRVFRGPKSFQYHIPTIDQSGTISFNRKAPGGHALFGVEALLAAYREEWRPSNRGLKLISSIGNGEDLSSSPDQLMTSWMIDNQVPIAMVTTTKTEIDLKGGQIALLKEDGQTYVTMMEKAQADESGQSELFMELGLREQDREAFFNTNMVLLNYEILTPLIEKLVSEVGEDKFFEIISPDLIINAKKQVDKDGQTRTYRQLEGAMGTVFLNLDRYWRQHYKTPMVHFVNVDRQNRTKFFSPIKTAFDYFMQLHSDRFSLENYRLNNCVPGKLPQVDLKDESYKEVQNVLDRFENCSIRELSALKVSGIVSFCNCSLIGKIEVENHSKELVEIASHLKEIVNSKIVIDQKGAVSIMPLS